MKTLPSSAATNASGRKTSSLPARAVPTSTGAIAAGSVRGRAATSHIRNGTLPPARRTGAPDNSGPARKAREVRLALLDVGVAALLALLRHVEEHRGVAGELLDAGEPVGVGVECA